MAHEGDYDVMGVRHTPYNKVLPAPRPLHVRSDLHGPMRLWRENGVARILREPVCERSGGGPRRQHKNVIRHVPRMNRQPF
jgi:hypothetical protein